MPTKENPDCTQCDYTCSTVAEGVVGAFEGGGYHHCDIYRPEYNCKINLGGISGDSGFCAVCRRTISDALEIYEDHTVNCYAPTFAKQNFLVCLLLYISSPLMIAVLIILAPCMGVCPLRRFLYYLGNCTKGNDNPCIRLTSSKK